MLMFIYLNLYLLTLANVFSQPLNKYNLNLYFFNDNLGVVHISQQWRHKMSTMSILKAINVKQRTNDQTKH